MRKQAAAKRRRGSCALGGALALFATSALADANLQNIRIARHDDHVRVVLDLDASVTFVRSGDQSFSIEGLTSGSAVMDAGPRDAPLTRVVLEGDGAATKLSFETKAAANAKAFLVEPSGSNGHRLVVDLYPAAAPAEQKSDAAAAQTPPALSPSVPAPDVPAVAAVPAVAKLAPPPAVAATAEPVSTEAAPSPAIVAETVAAEPAENLPAIELPPEPPVFERVAAAPAPSVPAISAAPAPTESPRQVASVLAPPVTSAPAERAIAAERALDKGDAGAACNIAEDTLRTAPQELRALAVLGWCRLAKHDAAGARVAFASALASDPGYHRARIGLAAAEARLGNLTAARAEYARVLADDPPTEDAYRIIDALDALKRPASSRGA